MVKIPGDVPPARVSFFVLLVCRRVYTSWQSQSPRGGGYFITSNTGRSMTNIWGLKFYVHQYLGSVNYNMDKNSIFRVRKSEENRKNLGIWFGSPRYWTQYLWSPKRQAQYFGVSKEIVAWTAPPY